MIGGLIALSGWVVLGASSACSSAPAPLDRGGVCLQSTECALGLACVPLADGRRICSDDLTAVQTTDPNAFDAGASDAPGDVIIYADAGAGTYDSGSPPPPDDASPPPPDDAGADDATALR